MPYVDIINPDGSYTSKFFAKFGSAAVLDGIDPSDKFSNTDELAAPSRAPFTITPHDTNKLPLIPKGIYVGTGGDVTLRGVGAAADVTYRNLPDASYIAVRALYVRATGTTAADLIAEA